MHWGQLSRPYSSTDRSSSLGSMESLDAPTPTPQPYTDTHSSPVDPGLFNNKRDSAYSSFSASSNTSDYTLVPLRPGEAGSMDNFLQSLGPTCRAFPGGDVSTLGGSSGEAPDEAQMIGLKSRSLTRLRPRPIKVKPRPSSCCYDEGRGDGDFDIMKSVQRGTERKMNPPQPPTRKDSFKATRSCPNSATKRCASAPIEISTVPCYYDEEKSAHNEEPEIHNGFSVPAEGEKDESYYTRRDYISDKISDDPSVPLTDPPRPNTFPVVGSLSAESSIDAQGYSDITHSQTKLPPTGRHRHSAPEKLLTAQLELLHFNSDTSSLESYNPSYPASGRWSHSEDQDACYSHVQTTASKRGGSRCSTPGSVFFEGDREDGTMSERLEETGVGGKSLSPTQHPHPWGRSVSVPEDAAGHSEQRGPDADRILERDFVQLSAAASVDTLLEDQRTVDNGRVGGGDEENGGDTIMKKSNPSRNQRRNRRRNERFATNLRNEIQRKKAQLQSSRGPGDLLCSGETVQEEEGPDICEKTDGPDISAEERSTKVPFAASVDAPNVQTTEADVKSGSVYDTRTPAPCQNQNLSRSVQIVDPGVPNFGVGIRVVEELAPAGKARRWRWTPEHKLQPDPKPDRLCGVRGERVLGIVGSRHGVCAFTSSSSSYSRSSSCSRIEESDIPPFADRRKFFEETSKGVVGADVSGLSGGRQKKSPHRVEQQEREPGQHPAQRRYSYQGGPQQENSTETRRPSVCSSRERQQEREEKDNRAMEREQEMETVTERARLREIQQKMEREERVKQRERGREMQLELERKSEKERRDDGPLSSRQESFGSSCLRDNGFSQKENFHPQSTAFCLSQTPNQVQRSAFYPVSTSSQPLENQHPVYAARSHVPAEVRVQTQHAPPHPQGP